MVSKESTTWFMLAECIENQIPIVSDHSQLVKFTSRADHNYLAFRSKLKELAEHHLASSCAFLECKISLDRY